MMSVRTCINEKFMRASHEIIADAGGKRKVYIVLVSFFLDRLEQAVKTFAVKHSRQMK